MLAIQLLRSVGHFFLPTLRSSSIPGLITKLRARMVDYNNPVTITREYFTAQSFPSLSGSVACRLNLTVCLRLRNSVTCEALACRGWYIYVSLPALPCFPSVTVILRLQLGILHYHSL